MPKKVYIKENSWYAKLAAKKLRSAKVAMVLGSTIHLHNTTTAELLEDKQWLCHELTHVAQYQQYGRIGFLIRYLWESMLHGYKNNKYEIEARANENNMALIEKYDLPTFK